MSDCLDSLPAAVEQIRPDQGCQYQDTSDCDSDSELEGVP